MSNTQVDRLAALDAFTRRAMSDWAVPGLAVALVKDDAVVWARGYGVREIGSNDAIDEHTLFAIASNSKAFTATALGLLVQEGRLSWDNPVIRYLPGFRLWDPYVTEQITIRDLLCHRCGLATWAGDLIAFGSRYSRDELLERVRYLKPASGFRARFGYANLMFVAAGQVIAAVTGTSWDAFVTERLLRPLGMVRSHTGPARLPGLDNVATPHTEIAGRAAPIPYRANENMGPAGDIHSSAAEMAQWLRLQLGGGCHNGTRLVDAAVIEELRTPHTPMPIDAAGRALIPSRHLAAYGLGFFLMDYQGRLVVWHDGGLDGMLSRVALLPEENLGIVVLTNYDHHLLHSALVMQAIDAFLGVPTEDWSRRYMESWREANRKQAAAWEAAEHARRPGTQPSLPLARYAGTYAEAAYGDATVHEDDGRLTLQLGAHPDISGALEHWHDDTFLCTWSDPVFGRSLVPFTLDGQGHVQGFRLKVREDFIDPTEYVFTRVAEPAGPR